MFVLVFAIVFLVCVCVCVLVVLFCCFGGGFKGAAFEGFKQIERAKLLKNKQGHARFKGAGGFATPQPDVLQPPIANNVVFIMCY